MDPYIQAMLRDEYRSKKKEQTPKSQTEIDLENQIDSYVDGLEFEEEVSNLALLSPKLKKERIKMTIKEALKFPELTGDLERAIKLLFSEGAAYLSIEANQLLLSDFLKASDLLAESKSTDIVDINFQELAKISDESMKSILIIAIAKFSEEKYEDCLSLFSLLTVLSPAYSEYWIRLGIAAQKCLNFDLALGAYEAASELDPDLIEARLFAAECFISINRLEEAKKEVAKAKGIAERMKIDQVWLDLILTIETNIKNH